MDFIQTRRFLLHNDTIKIIYSFRFEFLETAEELHWIRT